jgi:hypothetical protein
MRAARCPGKPGREIDQGLDNLILPESLSAVKRHFGCGGALPNRARPFGGTLIPKGEPMRQREKLFGLGRPRALDRNAKARIMHLARCLARTRASGRQRGAITRAALEVLQALLWGFHNAKSGVCFPSYRTIAEAAHCAPSTVAEAIKGLEAADVLTWVNRIKRVREPCPDLLGANGWRWRVLRTSNAYAFNDPSPAADRPIPSKSDFGRETGESSLSLPLSDALDRLEGAFRGRKAQDSGRLAPA